MADPEAKAKAGAPAGAPRNDQQKADQPVAAAEQPLLDVAFLQQVIQQ